MEIQTQVSSKYFAIVLPSVYGPAILYILSA